MAIINVRILAKIFVSNDDGEILLLQRSVNDESRALSWDLPGGNVDYNENPNQTVLRELSEETGLVVNDSRIQSVGFETQPQYMIVLLFMGFTESTRVVLSTEHEKYKWVKPELVANTDILESIKKAALGLASQPEL
jgi:8-oxo-dGTP diphosphatase